MSKIMKIGNKYYDFGTKNASFLLTASELKTLGIKNYYFMLEVKFPQLGVQDIDPYKPDITAEEIGAIITECKKNPWFFFREVSHVVARGLGELPLYLHRAGCAAIWCFMNSIDFHLVQPRQTYKTTVITAIMSYMMLFEYRDCDIPYMHKTEKRCSDNVGLLRDYICALPKYMNPWAKMKHPPGLQSLKYEAHGVSIATESAPKSESVAADKMRGYSLFTWFIDEAEFIPLMKQVIDGSNPTIVQARIAAKAAGIRYCMIYASTPGDLETQAGKDFQHIIDNTPRFNESMYDLTDDELQAMFEPDLSGTTAVVEFDEKGQEKKQEEAPEPVKPLTMVYIEFDYKQLRKDENYLRAQYLEAVSKNTIGEYRRGVLLQRFRGADGALFNQEDIEYIQQHTRRPDHTVFIMKKYTLFIYNHEIKHRDLTSSTPYFDTEIPYLIGIDIAGARGPGDNTAIVITNPYTLEVCGELKSPYIGLLDLMKIIIALAEMIPKGIFCPETNNNGTSLIDLVQETPLAARFYKDPRKNLQDNVLIQDTKEQIEIKHKANEKRQIGTFVTQKVREAMFDLLKRYIHDYRELFYTEFLVQDICNLVRDKNGKILAAAGEHDDVVMAYNHTIYVLNYGYDLTRYGIDKRRCTFEKVYDELREHEEREAENTINNTLPYDSPTMYEQQLMEELVESNTMQYAHSNYVDEMGYRPEQYDRTGGMGPSDPDFSFSKSELDSWAAMQVY